MRAWIVVIFAFCAVACSENNPTPVIERIPDSTIYLAGNASLWKNGVLTPLNDKGINMVHAMWVEGNTVMVSGHALVNSVPRNAIWKNGEVSLLEESAAGGITLVASNTNNKNEFSVWSSSNGWRLNRNGIATTISAIGWPTALAPLGDDAYTSANFHGVEHPWGSDFYSLDTYATCWKNGVEIFRETENSYANTITIHKNDIYLGGHLNKYPSLKKIACYWKNGQRTELTGADDDAEVRSLFITDEHVYAAGTINDQAVYWKDGVVTKLSTGTSIAWSVSVLGNDVYVAGKHDKYPAVWKNGVKQKLPDPDKQGEIRVVVAVKNPKE